MSKEPDFTTWPLELLIRYKAILDQLVIALALRKKEA